MARSLIICTPTVFETLNLYDRLNRWSDPSPPQKAPGGEVFLLFTHSCTQSQRTYVTLLYVTLLYIRPRGRSVRAPYLLEPRLILSITFSQSHSQSLFLLALSSPIWRKRCAMPHTSSGLLRDSCKTCGRRGGACTNLYLSPAVRTAPQLHRWQLQRSRRRPTCFLPRQVCPYKGVGGGLPGAAVVGLCTSVSTCTRGPSVLSYMTASALEISKRELRTVATGHPTLQQSGGGVGSIAERVLNVSARCWKAKPRSAPVHVVSQSSTLESDHHGPVSLYTVSLVSFPETANDWTIGRVWQLSQPRPRMTHETAQASSELRRRAPPCECAFCSTETSDESERIGEDFLVLQNARRCEARAMARQDGDGRRQWTGEE